MSVQLYSDRVYLSQFSDNERHFEIPEKTLAQILDILYLVLCFKLEAA